MLCQRGEQGSEGAKEGRWGRLGRREVERWRGGKTHSALMGASPPLVSGRALSDVSGRAVRAGSSDMVVELYGLVGRVDQNSQIV